MLLLLWAQGTGNGAHRLGCGSVRLGPGRGSCRKRYRDGDSAGLVMLRAPEAGTAVAQGSGVAEKQEAGRENMK